ncbi:MAG: NADH-quinone oxidoreductase subunit J [Gammaproteobacteria bacterium]|nr:NADH-quinone oxidoreductase subunit J [Gammaproteobacteria bacterium]
MLSPGEIIYQALFYLFAGAAVLAGLRMILTRNPVYSALFLVLAFVNVALLWVQMGAEFLGIILVLVYVGAVMVLFLFVVMMLDINLATLRQGVTRYAPLGLVVAGLIIAEIVWAVWGHFLGVGNTPQTAASALSNTRELGTEIYTHYLYAFEVAAAILVLGIVAAIALTLRWRPATKHQNPGQQMRVKADERRIRLVDLKAGKKGEES